MSRKPVLSDEQLEELKELHSEGLSYQALADHFDLSRPTIHRYLRKLGLTNPKQYSPSAPVPLAVEELRTELRSEAEKKMSLDKLLDLMDADQLKFDDADWEPNID